MARYFLNTGVLWSDINNWSDTDGGAGGFSVPTTTDDVYFTALSGPCTVNGSNRSCLKLITTGYNNTITITTVALTTGSDVTLSATTTVTGTGTFSFSNTGTLTRNSATISVATTRTAGSGVLTLADVWDVAGFAFTGSTATLNGSTLNVYGDISCTVNSTAGTTQVNLVGTGTQTWSGTGQLNNNFTINKPSGAFVVSGTVAFGGSKTFIYTTAGSVTTTGSTLNLGASTMDSSGMTWNNITSTSAPTVVLTTILVVGGTLSIQAVVFTTNSVHCQGNLTITSNTATTGTILMNGTGSQTWSGTPIVRCNLTINKPSGAFIVSGSVAFTTSTLTYTTSGSVTVTGSTLNISASCTLNTGTMVWNNVTPTGVNTYTLLSDFRMINYVSGANTQAWNGSGFKVYVSGNFTHPNGTISGTANWEYNGAGTWTGSTNVIQSNLTLKPTGVLTIAATNFTYSTGTLIFDSSGGGSVSTTGSTLIITASCSLNTNGIVWNNITQTNNTTITLTSNLSCSGLLSVAGSTSTWNGFDVSFGGLTCGSTLCSGTSTFTANGTGTIQSTLSTNVVRNNLTINTSGTITFGTLFAYNTGTLTYVTGTVTTTGSTLTIVASTTLNTNGIVWNNITMFGASLPITTLSSTLTINGTLSLGSAANVSTINGADIILNGNLLLAGTSNYHIGTSSIKMKGTGTISGSNQALLINLTIDTTGTITFVGTLNYRLATLTYITGTVVTTGHTLTMSDDTTLNTNGIIWNNVVFSNAFSATLTINSLLSITGNLTLSGAATVQNISGTSGFTCHTFICTVAGRIINFAAGKTYTVTNTLTVTGTSGSPVSFVSTSTGALFILNFGATQNVRECNATWIDSRGGQQINTSFGTLSNTQNWGIGMGDWWGH
jgi:fibronectin-binding autotransporter adhesin